MAWQPDYVSSAELKSFLRIDDTTDDIELAVAITAASRAIDNHTHRQFGLVASAEDRYYKPEWSPKLRRWVIPIDDLMTETGLVINADLDDDDTYDDAIDAYALRPVNAAAKGKPWTHVVVKPTSANLPSAAANMLVEVAARYGWTTVPVAIEQATLLQASRFHARRFSPYGIAGSPDEGSELRLLARVDPDVAVSLSSYVRWWAAA